MVNSSMIYPISIIGYFVVGAFGAFAFLVVLLLFDKDVAILKNTVIPNLLLMGAIYVVVGGILSAVLNVAASPDFGPNQYALAFGSGVGWPALATGIGASKKVGDINEEAKARIERGIGILDESGAQKRDEMQEYFNNRLQSVRENYQKTINLLSEEVENVRNYYSKRLVSAGGKTR